MFDAVCTNLEDAPRAGSSQKSSSVSKISRVEEGIREDRRLKVREIAESLDLLNTIINETVYEQLGYRKVSVSWALSN